jgi:hypothetical protein
MAFKRLDPEDFIVSSDSVTAPLWSSNQVTLNKFFTSSVQEAGSSGNFYLNIYQTSSTLDNAEVQFAIAYGDALGSGSVYYNSAVPGYSPSRTIYGQYRNLVLGDENASFTFGGTSSPTIYVISIDRNRYKESLLPGSLTLTLKKGSDTLILTDNSLVASSVVFNDAGRVYQLISGSNGVISPTALNSNGYSLASGSYGLFLPDIGTIILNPLAVGSNPAGGGVSISASRGNNTNSLNMRAVFNALSASNAAGSPGITLNSQETISSDYIFIRSRNAEFNYSENPSFISGSTGEVIFNSFINNPQTFPTTIGLYNDNNELLAVAKLSRPLLKDFTKEALVRVKLDF